MSNKRKSDNNQSDDKKSQTKKLSSRNAISIEEIKEIFRMDNSEELKRLLDDKTLDANMELIIGKGTDRSLLTIACTLAAIECVKLLLDKRADINKIPTSRASSDTNDFHSPLCCACASGSSDLVQLLIQRGVKRDDKTVFIAFNCIEHSTLSTNQRQAILAVLVKCIKKPSNSYHGRTFLHVLSSIGDADSVKAVLARGVDRDACVDFGYQYEGQDALALASKKGHLDVVKVLLEWTKSKPLNPNRVSTAMMEAAMYGHLDVVKVLPGCEAEDYTCALVEAMRYTKSFAVAEYLLDHGADVNGLFSGTTPLRALIEDFSERDLPLAQMLIARGANRDATGVDATLDEAGDDDDVPAERGSEAEDESDDDDDDDDIDHWYSDDGSYKESVDDSDAVKLAAQSGSPELMQLILDHGQGPPVSVDRLNEALLLSLGHSEGVTKCLLDHGAQVDTVDSDGHTPLLLLCARGHGLGDMVYPHVLPATIQILLERGADTSKVSLFSGDTALLSACDHSAALCHKIATLLLEHGADVNQDNATTGETPPMKAALAKRVTVVKLYLERGADVMQVNGEGLTVLDLMGAGPEYAKVAALCAEHIAAKLLLK